MPRDERRLDFDECQWHGELLRGGGDRGTRRAAARPGQRRPWAWGRGLERGVVTFKPDAKQTPSKPRPPAGVPVPPCASFATLVRACVLCGPSGADFWGKFEVNRVTGESPVYRAHPLAWAAHGSASGAFSTCNEAELARESPGLRVAWPLRTPPSCRARLDPDLYENERAPRASRAGRGSVGCVAPVARGVGKCRAKVLFPGLRSRPVGQASLGLDMTSWAFNPPPGRKLTRAVAGTGRSTTASRLPFNFPTALWGAGRAPPQRQLWAARVLPTRGFERVEGRRSVRLQLGLRGSRSVSIRSPVRGRLGRSLCALSVVCH